MDDKEINKQIKIKQKESRARREKESATRIGECLSTPKQEKKCPRCHKKVDELIITPEGCTHDYLCSKCESERLEWVEYQKIRDHRVQLEITRREREYKVRARKRHIQETIPPLFQKAKLRDLNYEFRRELMSYPREGLVLYGPVGTGKSYSACALLRYLIAGGKIAARIGYNRLCLEIRDTFHNNSSDTELSVLKRYQKPDILLIEDIGSSRSVGFNESDFSARVVYELLDFRQEQQMTTFFTTNKTRKELSDSFDQRISSRLSLLKWIGVGGRDKRQ